MCSSIVTMGTPFETIYIGVSIWGRLKDVQKALEPHLKSLLKPPKTRIRANDKWKYYLITYDLKTIGIDYERIAFILSEYYKPPKADVFDIRTIENYHKSALALINGGYKKYLYLSVSFAK